MLFLSIFLLHAISTSLCYDIELEGVMKVGQQFLKTLNQHRDLNYKLNLPGIQFISKGKLPKKAMGEVVMKAFIEPNKTDSTKPNLLQDYVDRLKKKGKRSLMYIGKLILNQLNIERNITRFIKAVTADFVTMIQNYHDFVTEKPEEAFVSNEFFYLDMVETACRLLYSEERKLLNDIIGDLNATYLNTTVRIMNEKIYRFSVNDKKNEIRYICETYKVCRKYPAFTDYCADLISEILKLSDEKFGKFLDILKNIVVSNDVFLSTLAEKEDKDMMASKLQKFSDDMNTMRELFAVLRSVITQRFKAVHGANDQLRRRTEAMRILLDIIDKSLTTEDDLMAIDFDTTVSAIRNWSGGLRKNIDDMFDEFAKHLLRVMEYSLTENAIKEISVLIEVIMRGTASSEKMYQHMLKYGSRYLNEDEFEPNLDLI